MKKIKTLLIAVGLIAPITAVNILSTSTDPNESVSFSLNRSSKVIQLTDEQVNGTPYMIDETNGFKISNYKTEPRSDSMYFTTTMTLELYGDLKLDINEIRKPSNGGKYNINAKIDLLPSDGYYDADITTRRWEDTKAIDPDGKNWGDDSITYDLESGYGPYEMEMVTYFTRDVNPIAGEGEDALIRMQFQPYIDDKENKYYFEYSDDIIIGETADASPPIINSFTSTEITDGIKLDWDVTNGEANTISDINIYYDGGTTPIYTPKELKGSFEHKGGEKGKKYKLEVLSKTDTVTKETIVKAEAIPPKINEFTDESSSSTVVVALENTTNPNNNSIEYGEGRLVTSDGTVASKTTQEDKAGLKCYFFDSGYSDFAGELFFEFTDTATGNIWTTNTADTSKKQINLNGKNESLTFLDPPRPVTVTLDEVEVKGEDNIDITITNDIPEHDDSITDTVINGFEVEGVDFLKDNITIISGTPTADGTYTVNVSGLTAGAVYFDWILTTKTNGGDVVTEITEFETIRPAIIPTMHIAAKANDQLSADVTYTIDVPTGDAMTTDTVVSSAVLNAEGKDYDLIADGNKHTFTVSGLTASTIYTWPYNIQSNAGTGTLTGDVTVITDDKSPNTTGEPTVDYTTVTPGYTDATMGVTLDITEGNATTSDVVIKSAEVVVTDGTNNITGSTISADEANMGVEQTVTFEGLAINTTYSGTLTAVYDNGSGTEQTATYDIEEFTTNDAVPTILTFESNITSTTSADIIYDIDVPDSTILTINSATIDYTDINGAKSLDVKDTIEVKEDTTVNVTDLEAGAETEFTLNIDYTVAGSSDSVKLVETILVETPESTISNVQLTDIKGGTATFVLEETFYIENPSDDMTVNVRWIENKNTVKTGEAKFVETNNARGFRTHTYEFAGLPPSATYTEIKVEVAYKTYEPEKEITVEYEGIPISSERPIITDDSANIIRSSENNKFPWWIIILLILITLVSVGIALFFILRKKEPKPKETKQAKA